MAVWTNPRGLKLWTVHKRSAQTLTDLSGGKIYVMQTLADPHALTDAESITPTCSLNTLASKHVYRQLKTAADMGM